MDIGQAAMLNKVVRAFFATGAKSGNKIYVSSSKDFVTTVEASKVNTATIQDLFDVKQPSFLVRMFSAKARLAKIAKRANDGQLSMANRDQTKYKSDYEMGESVYKSTNQNFAAGNCGEMAAVSAYIAISQGLAQASEVYIGTIGAPGDHVFCAIGPQPSGASVGTMTGSAVIVDPWLNTCCTAGEYFFDAQDKLKKWHRDGKRVLGTGPSGQLGWADPGGTYATTFVTAPLTYVLAKP